MKHVYFVRHGETLANAHFIQQSPSTPISDIGRDQIRTAAEYLRPMNIDCVVTSDYTRAKQSANIISRVIEVPVIENALFHEIEKPTRFYDKSHLHPVVLLYLIHLLLNRKKPSAHYYDAENLTEMRKRINAGLSFLNDLGNTYDSIVVVSHKIYINLLAAYMCKDRSLSTLEMLPHILHLTGTKNGAVVHLESTDEQDGCACAWKLSK